MSTYGQKTIKSNLACIIYEVQPPTLLYSNYNMCDVTCYKLMIIWFALMLNKQCDLAICDWVFYVSFFLNFNENISSVVGKKICH